VINRKGWQLHASGATKARWAAQGGLFLGSACGAEQRMLAARGGASGGPNRSDSFPEPRNPLICCFPCRPVSLIGIRIPINAYIFFKQRDFFLFC
jgi:hypothetical protein